MKETLRTVGSALAAVAFFFLLSGGFGFHPAAAGALSVAIYFGFYYLLKPSAKIGKVHVDSMKNGEDSERLMEEAKKDIASMERLLPRIQSGSAQMNVQSLIRTGKKILSYLTEHPGKIMEAHRFADYY